MMLIAIGANLPGMGGQSPFQTCRAAAEALAGLPGFRLQAMSRWFATRPIPASDQPDYVNGVARLEGPAADPADVLQWLHAIEARAGRVRSEANAARVLDLDLVAIGGLIREGEAPILPHPRAHQRAFVLAPLNDVAPDWVHPLLGQTARDMLTALPTQDIRPL